MIALSILLVSLFAAPVPLSDSLTAILRQAMPDEVGAALLAYAARHPTGESP
jgi:hypothetical protein